MGKKGTHNGRPTIHDHQKSNGACRFSETYKNDIQRFKNFGLNAFRYAIDWSLIEPNEGEFSEEALNYYSDLCDELINAGQKICLSCVHFTLPKWFAKMGGFEKEENIKYFVRFCKHIFSVLKNKVHLWCTMNEPGAYVFQSYIHGEFPPGKTNPWLGLKVLRNMLLAHVRVYNALKKLPGGKEAQIGLVHSYVKFESHSRISVLEHIPRIVMNYLFNGAILNGLKTGVLFPWIPGLRTKIPIAKKCNDFFGLNFYGHVVLESHVLDTIFSLGKTKNGIVEPSCFQGEVMTDMPYPIDPEGFYYAIKDVAQLGLPIYITENGISDKNDDRRALFIMRYLYAMSKAIKEGYDVRGYFYWSPLDNFEWNHGYHQKFGLWHVDFDTQERTLRRGSKVLQEAIRVCARK